MNDNMDLVKPTAALVAAYVGNNHLPAADVPGLIRSVYVGLVSLKPAPPPPVVQIVPAVPIKQSITTDYLISLEDGRKYRTLKRHLSARGMTPAQYRTKWGLTSDYPMTAPGYARARSAVALSAGFGRKDDKRPTGKPKGPGSR